MIEVVIPFPFKARRKSIIHEEERAVAQYMWTSIGSYLKDKHEKSQYEMINVLHHDGIHVKMCNEKDAKNLKEWASVSF